MESNNSWKVICTGNIKADFTEEIVLKNILQLFKFSNEKARMLIQGTPTTVKKGLTKQEALQYKQVLQEAGVETTLEAPTKSEKFSLDELSLVPLEVENNSDHDKTSEEHVTCPECYNQQPPTIKCLYCGISIENDPVRAKTPSKSNISDSQFKPTPSPAKMQAYACDAIEDQETITDKIIEKKQSILVIIVLLILVRIFYLNGTTYQDVGKSPEALAQIETLNLSVNYPSPDGKELRGLLQSKKYYQLESILSELNDKVHHDISWESAFRRSINLLSNQEKVSINMLDNWVNTTESAYAYLARGAYYADAGATARGFEFTSETSDDQFAAMNKLYLSAYSDLIHAKEIDSSLLPTYALLIQINVGDGSYNPRDLFLKEAILANPAGNQYRYVYMNYIKPKWGGSWEMMDSFASETSAYASLNPRLNLLTGYMSAEKGDIAKIDDDFDACISHYSKALQHGIHSEWLRHRAYCLYDNGDFEEALKDITLFFKYFDHATSYDKQLKRYLVSKVN
ncbi:MAG: ribosomal protein L7/L12 [Alteromonadales bacterium]|nr:ribosomal protein L7/L12 [Alteromonadales bacterium]